MEQLPTVCIVTFIYQLDLTEDEINSYLQLNTILPGRTIYVVTKDSLAATKEFVDLLSVLPLDDPIVLPVDDDCLASTDSYNQLMMSSWFYRNFLDFDYILIYQSDCWVFHDSLDTWCASGYSYIGAPWFGSLQKFTSYIRYVGVGNGGLSLRSIHDSIVVLENLDHYRKHVFSFSEYLYLPILPSSLLRKWPLKPLLLVYAFLSLFGFKNQLQYFANFSASRVNEDIFWGIIVPRVVPGFFVPSMRVASRFSLETNYKEAVKFFQTSPPFGGHALKKYGYDPRPKFSAKRRENLG